MKTNRLVSTIAGLWIMPLVIVGWATAEVAPSTDVGGHVLTRGPIHEAFAEAVMSDAAPGALIAKAPRFPITELPPDQRPEGNNVAWIPGYWGWEDSRNDFIWVSGVWRDIPPGRQWVPGYWGTVEGGSRWVSGFWGDVAQTDVTYLPAPPEPLEVGPNVPQPGPNHVWTSGSWVWQQNRYDWQPGYWLAQQPDWVWSPAHYTWTPRGYVYVPGFWDHEITHRGVMFAPVYYDQPVYMRSNYSYSPSTIIDLGAVLVGLFVRSQSNHYFYGDYYDDRDEGLGYRPWYSHHSSQYGYDPIFAQYRNSQLNYDPNWDTHAEELFRHRRDNVGSRPPQTLALQVNFINNTNAGNADNVIIGRSLADAVTSKTLPRRFTSVSADERKQITDRGRKVRKLELERAKVEALPKVADITDGAAETVLAVKEKLPASPVAATVEDSVKVPPTPPAPEPRVAKGTARKVNPDRVESKTEPTSEAKAERKEARKAANIEEPIHGTPEVKPSKSESTLQPPNSEPKTSSRDDATKDAKAESGTKANKTAERRKEAANTQAESSQSSKGRGNKSEASESKEKTSSVSSEDLDPPAAKSTKSGARTEEEKRDKKLNK